MKRNGQAILLGAALLMALLACKSKKESKGTTIQRDSKGGVTVKGGSPLVGDPKTCAAVKACCKLPQMGLACGLTRSATKGDCAAALKSVRKQIGERGLTAPAGCQ